jgi:3-deoxy-D-manno-octulosonic-acid transferase
MQIIYNIFIRLYFIFVWAGSLFNRKAGKWVKGRKNWEARLRNTISPHDQIVWFHAASLGEFEQGRPVIEAFRQKYPHYKILLTFFSPSGYEIRKDYPGADYIFYLPLDTQHNARKFTGLIKPQLAIFIKYEYWYNFLSELHKNKIPVFVISAIFRHDQIFFRWYGTWFLKQLRKISRIFVQNNHSLELLKGAGLSQSFLSGDTRFDRVDSIATSQIKNRLVESFCTGYKVMIGGSTWPPDEKLLVTCLKKSDDNVKLIIAPHEIHEERIRSVETLFGDFQTIRYSMATPKDVIKARVLIIDGIGFLSEIYRYVHVALIGGGFGKGIHNILEAVTFGKPVLFGPQYKKFAEAIALIQKGGAFPVANESDLFFILHRLLNDDSFYGKVSLICREFIADNRGATTTILDEMEAWIILKPEKL